MLSVLVVALGLLGVVLWAVLFRFLQLASSLIKIVVTIGLSVCLGAVTILLFGNNSAGAPPGLAPQPEPIYHVAGASLTLDQIIIYVCVIVVIGGGAAVLKFQRNRPADTGHSQLRRHDEAVRHQPDPGRRHRLGGQGR